MAQTSGEPASSCSARATPSPSVDPMAGRRAAVSKASSTQGIVAAPAKCVQRFTDDCIGPESANPSPAVQAPARPAPSRAASRFAPRAATRRFTSTKAVYAVPQGSASASQVGG